jgi:hypothetical protein
MYLSGKLIRYNQHKQQLGDNNKGHVEAIPSQCTDSLIKTNILVLSYIKVCTNLVDLSVEASIHFVLFSPNLSWPAHILEVRS